MVKGIILWILALAAILLLAVPPAGAAVASHATHRRCQHETVNHIYYSRCESRHGDFVTYTFTEILTVRV